MRRVGVLIATTVLLLVLEVVLPAGETVAQQKSLKEQLVGTWKLVSVANVRNEGSKRDVSGPNPRGVVIYTSDGHFAVVDTRSDVPRLASTSRDTGTPEEEKAVVQVSIAYFSRYSVNETDKVITLQIEGSTLENVIGRADQKRIVTSLTSDELSFMNPGNAVR